MLQEKSAHSSGSSRSIRPSHMQPPDSGMFLANLISAKNRMKDANHADMLLYGYGSFPYPFRSMQVKLDLSPRGFNFGHKVSVRQKPSKSENISIRISDQAKNK